MKPPEIINTQRLTMRKPRMDDAEAAFAGWVQDPEVARFLTWNPHQTIRETKAIFKNAIALWDEEDRFPYTITLKESGQVIGMIDLRVEGPKVAIGYVLGRAYQRNGYMTEATRAIIAWALEQPAIYRVYATTDVENIPSQRVLEKSGMQREGLLRKYIVHPNISEVPRDSYIYAIVR